MKFKVGDVVKTKKGCRIQGPPLEKLIVIEINRKWSYFDAVMCEYDNKKSFIHSPSKHLFLCKNLYRVKDIYPKGLQKRMVFIREELKRLGFWKTSIKLSSALLQIEEEMNEK